MKPGPSQQILEKLLLRGGSQSRLWAALLTLFTGATLLLLSVMIWWNFNELLYGKTEGDSLGETFLTIGKNVTNANMGRPSATIFSDSEIISIEHAPEVQSIGLITSNHFPVYATIGGSLALQTDLPLESVPDSFLDALPADWKWQPGQPALPIIISTQFLDIYNYMFAPSQHLPQLSRSSVQSIAIRLKAGTQDVNETFLAHVVGFSDRINAVLAPQSFIDYGNNRYGLGGAKQGPSQLIIKARDPSDTKFADYLNGRDYTTNSQNLRWSRVRAIVEIVASATGILAALLMGISILVFILFIELVIARAEASLQLLLQIGYSPKFLRRFMSRHFLPLVSLALVLSLGAALAVQVIASFSLRSQGLGLSLLPGWPVWGVFGLCSVVLVTLIRSSIQRAIKA